MKTTCHALDLCFKKTLFAQAVRSHRSYDLLPQESLDLFEKMRTARLDEGEATLRLKMDMSSPNPNMWDQVSRPSRGSMLGARLADVFALTDRSYSRWLGRTTPRTVVPGYVRHGKSWREVLRVDFSRLLRCSSLFYGLRLRIVCGMFLIRTLETHGVYTPRTTTPTA